MARSIEYWYDIMTAEKASMASLNAFEPNIDSSQQLATDLKSTSKVGRWRTLFWCVAACAHALDVVLDLAILTMEGIAAKSSYGNLPWWVDQMKAFQYGDSLVLIDNKFQYAVIDDSKKVINMAAAHESLGTVAIKIAKLVGGVRQPLPVAEYNAALGYAQKIRPAGVNINLINDDPDDFKLFLDVNFDPLVLTSAGELISTPGTFPVTDAINEYLDSLEFDGAIELMKLVDKVQAATGVKSAYVTDAQARYGVAAFASFYQRYFPNAGYAVLHADSVITYTPYV